MLHRPDSRDRNGAPLADSGHEICLLVARGIISGQRGPFPVELLFLPGDMGSIVLVMWLVMSDLGRDCPGIPIGVTSRAGDGIPLMVAVVSTAVALGLSLAGAAAYVRTRRQRT
jgi:hypothetical protein